ncbi:MAG: glycosyltransferase [Verrucomicrobia bacterium]|nr:glycosyltransferase [Verrucomicrobiota bacterium]
MSEPFFSILLPTKNRAEIVAGAIESVLTQTCGDFELIVSDNDDSPTDTRDSVARFSDPRLRYFRTSGNLAMHENWEFARRQAKGKWVLIVEDKQRLSRTALATLKPVCEAHPDAIVTYPPVLAFADLLPGPTETARTQIFTCEETVEHFCRFTARFWEIFPRGLTSATPRTMLDDIERTSPTGLVFSWVNPDYSYGFQALSRARELVYVADDIIYVPLSVGRAGKYSNGLAATRKEGPAKRFFASLPVGEQEMLKGLPVRSVWLWVNPVLFDFYKFYHRPGHAPQVDWVSYHAQCIHIILVGREWGADMSAETQAVRDSLRKLGLWFTIRVLLLTGFRSARGLFLRLVNLIRHRRESKRQ